MDSFEVYTRSANDVVITIEEDTGVQTDDVATTIEEVTATTTLTNISTQTEDTPTEIPQCRHVLSTVTPQRAWGLVYANYNQNSLEVPVVEKITWKFAALLFAWIFLALFALSVGCEWYLEATVAHTVEGMLAIVGFVGIYAVIYITV